MVVTMTVTTLSQPCYNHIACMFVKGMHLSFSNWFVTVSGLWFKKWLSWYCNNDDATVNIPKVAMFYSVFLPEIWGEGTFAWFGKLEVLRSGQLCCHQHAQWCCHVATANKCAVSHYYITVISMKPSMKLSLNFKRGTGHVVPIVGNHTP